MTDPLVTIAIPSYNCGKFLEKTIQSVLNQTYRNIQIVVIDDASTDNSMAAIEAIRDPRLAIEINHTNLGMIGNWNKALLAGHGEFVKVLCGDDELMPNAIEKQVALLQLYSDASMAACRKTVINAKGKTILKSLGINEAALIPQEELVHRCLRCGTNPVGEPGSVLIRRSKIGEHRFSSGAWTIDLDLWVKLSGNGPLATTPEPLASFRMRPGSSSAVNMTKSKKEVTAFLNYLRKQYPRAAKRTPATWSYVMILARSLARRAVYELA